MSQQARDNVIDSPYTFFSDDCERDDLRDITRTDTNLIALIEHLLSCGHIIHFTSIRCDHHDDGPNGHAGGFAFDCWPLKTPTADDWLDATDVDFQGFLHDVGDFGGIFQIGLAGSADTPTNRSSTGLPYEEWDAPSTVFSDQGGDHVHCGVHGA
jgi:hypothetical protein